MARVFGPLKGNDYPNEQAVDSHDIGQNSDMVSLLREQLAAALHYATREREQQAIEQGREREARLLTLLEVEQAARRELETKLLPAPVPPLKPAPPSHRRVWLLLILLVAVLAFAGWRWGDAIRATVATLLVG